jgi:hypothetical protein
MGHITQHGDIGEAHFHAAIDLGRSVAPWRYDGVFTLRRIHSAWKVEWSPSVINPALKPGYRLAVVTTTPRRAPLLDQAAARWPSGPGCSSPGHAQRPEEPGTGPRPRSPR